MASTFALNHFTCGIKTLQIQKRVVTQLLTHQPCFPLYYKITLHLSVKNDNQIVFRYNLVMSSTSSEPCQYYLDPFQVCILFTKGSLIRCNIKFCLKKTHEFWVQKHSVSTKFSFRKKWVELKYKQNTWTMITNNNIFDCR